MRNPEQSPPDAAVSLSVVPWAPPTRERHLIEAITRVHAERDEPGVLLMAVQAVERTIAGASSALFQVDQDAQVVSLRAAGPRWRTAERDAPAWLTRETGGLSAFARGGVSCAGRWWRRPGSEAEAGGCDIARVRVMLGDELWGMLVVVRPSSGGDAAQDAWFIEALAVQVGHALRHVSDRSELQRALAAARESHNRATRDERLRVLGQVASGVAHDFNNALTSILGVTEWLTALRSDDAELVQELALVRQAAGDAAALVRRLHYFGKRKTPAAREITPLAEMAATSVDLVRSRVHEVNERQRVRIGLSIECDDDPVVDVDPVAIREVLASLLTNAIDASHGGGEIVVRIGREGREAYAAVVDHGEGMDESTRGRVFEPFFTTKGRHGAGLGLSLCWSIVEGHGGRIGVASSRGVGSTFTVWLPIAAAHADVAAGVAPFDDAASAASGPATVGTTPVAEAAPQPQGTAMPPETGSAAAQRGTRGRILVLDDQADVRSSVVDMLGALGYATEAVASGEEGLALAGESDFDLVITDLGMPGLSGLDVARGIHREQPDLPIVLLTGWGTHFGGRPPADIARVVAKPVSMATLETVIAQLVGRTQA